MVGGAVIYGKERKWGEKRGKRGGKREKAVEAVLSGGVKRTAPFPIINVNRMEWGASD